LADNDEISGAIFEVLGRGGDLSGRRIVVSAGGTQEAIDLARYVGNRSSGKMGYAIAEAARDRGASVILVTGPTALSPPAAIEVVHVTTAQEMQDAVRNAVAATDVIIMAAAVADYRAASVSEGKIKRESDTLALELVKTPDIVGELSGDFIKVGFAAESDDMEARAVAKLKRKQLDLIAVNDISAEDSGFEVDTNRVMLIGRDGKAESLPLMLKSEVAHKILDRVVALLARS